MKILEKKKMTIEEKVVKRYVEDGLSKAKVGREFGISETKVTRILKDHNTKCRGRYSYTHFTKRGNNGSGNQHTSI